MGLNSVNNYNEPIVFLLQVLQSMACIVSDFNSMPPYVLLDVQWCSKTCALKILLTTSGFTEYQKIYSAHEDVITFLFYLKFKDTKGYLLAC